MPLPPSHPRTHLELGYNRTILFKKCPPETRNRLRFSHLQASFVRTATRDVTHLPEDPRTLGLVEDPPAVSGHLFGTLNRREPPADADLQQRRKHQHFKG